MLRVVAHGSTHITRCPVTNDAFTLPGQPPQACVPGQSRVGLLIDPLLRWGPLWKGLYTLDRAETGASLAFAQRCFAKP